MGVGAGESDGDREFCVGICSYMDFVSVDTFLFDVIPSPAGLGIIGVCFEDGSILCNHVCSEESLVKKLLGNFGEELFKC